MNKQRSVTVGELVADFLASKRAAVKANQITQRMLGDYDDDCQRVIDEFGAGRPVLSLSPEDFASFRAKLSEKYGLNTFGVIVARIRSLFKHGYDSGVLEAPVRLGQGFNPPDKEARAELAARKAEEIYSGPDIETLLNKTAEIYKPHLAVPCRLMILLGINNGFANTDVADLPLDAAMHAAGGGILHVERNGLVRRCPLWPRTLRALLEMLKLRETQKAKSFDDDWRLFLSGGGSSWIAGRRNTVSDHFSRLSRFAGVQHGFLALRRTFLMLAGEQCDESAVEAILGVPQAAASDRRVSDDRLHAVTRHVYARLFENKPPPSESAPLPANQLVVSRGQPMSESALKELRLRLTEQGCGDDARKVAAAFVRIARAGQWFKNPQAMMDWFSQLALDVVAESNPNIID